MVTLHTPSTGCQEIGFGLANQVAVNRKTSVDESMPKLGFIAAPKTNSSLHAVMIYTRYTYSKIKG